MADVDTSFYKQQQNPLATITSAVGIMNTFQQNQLLQTANKQRQFDLNKAQSDSVIGTLGPLAARGDVNKATALGTVASIIKAQGIPPQIAGPLLEQLQNAPDNPKAIQPILGNLYAIMSGAGAGTPVSGAVQPGTLAPTQVPAAARVTQGAIPVTAGPSATAAASTAGTAAGGLLGSEATNNSDYRRQVTPLEQAIPALERLGKTGTGPGTDEFNQIKSFLQSAGIPGFDPDKIKNFDEAKKYLTDWVRANGDTSTNDKLAASFSSNASVHISNAAAVDVAKTALAIRRMKYMQLQEFYNSGLPPDEFAKWSSQWNARHDPRAFGFDHLSVPQRKQVIGSLPAAKRSQFMLDVDAADKAGVLTNQ